MSATHRTLPRFAVTFVPEPEGYLLPAELQRRLNDAVGPGRVPYNDEGLLTVSKVVAKWLAESLDVRVEVMPIEPPASPKLHIPEARDINVCDTNAWRFELERCTGIAADAFAVRGTLTGRVPAGSEQDIVPSEAVSEAVPHMLCIRIHVARNLTELEHALLAAAIRTIGKRHEGKLAVELTFPSPEPRARGFGW